MNIIVCIKQVPDPEGPQSCFVINPRTSRVEPKGIPPVLSLFDENALEAALKIRDNRAEKVKITVVSMGKRISQAVLEKALAVGADELVKVEGEEFESGGLDSFATASALSCAIRKIGAFDLVLGGRQAADWNAGQVGVFVAGLLGIPAVTLARRVEIQGDHAVVERILPFGYETVRARLPVAVMVSNEAGVMRYPTLIQRREAKKKPVRSWGAADIGFEPDGRNRVVLRRLFTPEMRQGPCRIIGGATPAEAGRNLAERLKQDGVL
ncbi:MAG: electron transfer flavoprotein subunit beta/FixA family protein [bacterium]